MTAVEETPELKTTKFSWLNAGVAALLVLFVVLVLRRAWLSDDAYITFRTVDNFINGYRLTWNPGERVQAYTHPLWMLLLSVFYFFTREIYFTSIFLSIALSLAAVSLLPARIARTRTGAALAIAALALSNAFVDYATSGLENPLSHVLLAVFAVLLFNLPRTPRSLLWLSGAASLAAVNRMDSVLIYAPALLVAWLETEDKKRGLLMGVLGQAPLLLWELFSLVYYGFPFPNTYYAKLYTGIPQAELTQQGLYYFLNSLERDPLTLAVIAFGVIAAVLNREKRGLALAGGVGLYLLYIVRIGGDFMSGRFFTLPLLAAAVLISRLDFEKIGSEAAVLLFAVVAGLGLMSPIPTYQLYGPEDYAVVDGRGIADERVWYFPDVALIHSSRMKVMPDSVGKYWGIEARELGKQDLQVNPSGNIGLYGYYAGPKVHIIDWFALADALEARLPAKRMVNWRIGHFERVVPKGYVSTAYAPGNRIEDQDLAKFYDQLALIIKGDLFSRERWQAIWMMNTHQLDDLIDFETYRYPDTVERTAKELAPLSGKKVESISMNDSGAVIALPDITHAAQLEISLDSNDEYQVIYYQGQTIVAEQSVNAPYTPEGLALRRLTVPLKAAQTGFDRVRVLPVRGDDSYHLGVFQLVE